jgi:hypothetical protein
VKFRLTHSTISQIGQAGDTFFSSADSAYLVFLCIGIVGYFTVPNVANYIVHAGGGNAMLQKVNSLMVGGTSTGISTAQGGAGMIVDQFDKSRSSLSKGMAEMSGADYFKDKLKS